MPANIGFNPVLVTNAPGTFFVTSDGYVQGTMMDDPAVRYALSGGILGPSETLPMWGGVAIFEDIPGASGATIPALGSIVGRAASNAAIAGFSVFNQASNWVTSPQSECPSAGNGMTVPFFRLGSGARIAVAADPSLASLEGGATNQNVSWDINNQRLQPYVASGPTISVTSITWSAGTGTVVMAAPAEVGAIGDAVNISGATNSGTGGNAAVNGNFILNGFTDNEHFTIAMPAASGVIGTIAGTIILNVGIGALPVKVLNLQIGNSQIVTYDAVNNYVHWGQSGSCALILL
jgi:hypothetical protein